jgi:hypothetical protein
MRLSTSAPGRSAALRLAPYRLVLCGLLAAVAGGCAAPAGSPVGAPSEASSASVPATVVAPDSAPPTAGGTGPTASASAGPALGGTTLIAFVQVDPGGSGGAAGEVTAPDRLDRFLVGPAQADRQVRDAVQRHRGAGVRLFAFPLSGCQNDGATLLIQGERVYAVLTGGVGVQCLVAEEYLAVFAVSAGLVPPRARIG